MSGHHPYYNPHDGHGGRGHNKHGHHQHQQHMQAQAPAFQPGMYHYSQLQPPMMQQPQQPPQYGYGAPQHTMPGGYGSGGPVSYPQHANGAGPYYPQQQAPPPQQYGQQYYKQPPQQQHMHHAPQHQQQHYHHHQEPPQHQQHINPNPPSPAMIDPAVAEAEVRKAVEAALATPSLLRGAAAGSGSGGYTFAKHRGGGKQQQQGGATNLLKKISGGALPFDVVCALPAVKRAAQGDRELVQRALEASEALAVMGGGKQQRVARKDMLPGAPAADLPYRCVTLTRLPRDKATEAGVRALVAAYGKAACVVVVGGEQEEGAGSGAEGEEEATAAGRGPPMLEVKAVVEFAEGKAAVKCVEALSGGSDWRRGLRAEFTVGGFTLPQAAKHFGVELAGGAGGSGSNGEAAADAAGNPSSSSSSSAMPASVRDARLPPTFPEGTHTGVVMEMIMGFATAPAADGTPAADPVQVQRGVIKREGRVRNQISFELPAAELVGVSGVGERVDFVVKHVENKAVVVSVKKSTAPPPAPLRVVKKEAASSSGTPFVQAKGPDEKGGVGFLLPRTKPTEAMQGLLDSMRQLKLGAAATAGKSG